jgi:hypothetical protein
VVRSAAVAVGISASTVVVIPITMAIIAPASAGALGHFFSVFFDLLAN